MSMQTSQVSNAANALSVPSSANKQSDANSTAEPFGSVLSREVSQRSTANDAPRQSETNNGSRNQAQSTNAPAKQADAKSNKEAKAAEGADATDAAASKEDSAETAPVLPDDMLAFVANLAQLNPAAAKTAGDQAELTTDGKKDDKAGDLPVAAVIDPALAAQASAASTQGVAADVKTTPTDVVAKGSSGRSGVAASALTRTEVKTETGQGAKPELPLAQTQAATVKGEDLAAQAMQSNQAGQRDFSADLKETLTAATSAAATIQPAQQSAVNAAQQQLGTAAADKLTPRVGTPAWDQALGQKVVWMVAGEQQTASLTLNPPDLGPLQVVLNVTNSQANATFIAAQPEVRQALEAAMPKLRDMLGEAGIQLGQASVNSGNPNQQGGFDQQGSQQARGANNFGGRDNGAAEPAVRVTRVQPSSSGLGMVDTFA